MLYKPDVVTLSSDDKKPLFNKSKFDAAVEYVYKSGGYKPEMLVDEPLKGLMDEIADVLTDAYNSAIATSSVPPVMDSYLRNDLLHFSGFKTHAELQEVAHMLLTSEGNIKPFEQFARDVTKIHTDYNVNYLNAEYNFAISSSQMAAKWVELEADGDRYNLQYRTADDARVRETHLPLHNVTLPPSDPFWDKYYPPNGWGCRCTIVQVRKAKYETSDPEKASADGLASTRQMSNGIDKGAIFRFNPGKLRKVMPPKHPYYKVPPIEALQVQKVVETLYPEIKTIDDLTCLFDKLNKQNNWCARGFKSLQTTTKRGVNGYTNLRGDIWLTREKMSLSISGCNKLVRGGMVEKAEADAIATLWHELTHNRNKASIVYMTTKQRSRMELANEFIARNTLPEFYESMGNKIQYNEFMTNRTSTGYNTMVRNYDTIITSLGIDKVAVVDTVKKSLFENSYADQELGLINGLLNNGAGKRLKKAQITTLVKRTDIMSETAFKALVDELLVED